LATSGRFGQVNLYCTWEPATSVQRRTPISESFTVSAGSVDAEAVVVLEVTPDAEEAQASPGDITPSGRRYSVYAYPIESLFRDASWITVKPEDGNGAFLASDIPALVQRLFTGAKKVLPEGVAAYYVLHLGAFEHTNGKRRDGASRLVRPPLVDIQTYRALVKTMDAAITAIRSEPPATLGTPREATTSDPRDRLYFDHYSSSDERRGYVVLDPRMSMVVDGGQEDAYVLLDLAQQTTITPDGVAPSSYATMITRAIAWDANGDTRASLKDLEQLEHSAHTATVGEVLLSLSLAFVSGLLAVLLVQNLVPKQLAYPLAAFALASLAYLLYAPSGWRWASIAGLVCVGIGVALTMAILFVPDFAQLLPLPTQ